MSRFPGLIPLDFLLAYLRNKTKTINIRENLGERIIDDRHQVTPQMLQNVGQHIEQN